MINFEQVIFNNLMNNEEYCRKVIPYLEPRYFSKDHKVAYDLYLSFLTKYNKLPSASVLSSYTFSR